MQKHNVKPERITLKIISNYVLSTLLLCVFALSCTFLFPPIPEVNENLVEANVNDSLSAYIDKLDSQYTISKNQQIVNPELFNLNTNGWYYILSPDSTKIAYIHEQEDWKMGYHKILIWDIKKQTTIPVCAFREGDPGSGISHTMSWSIDSKMLYIVGFKFGEDYSGIYIDEVFYQWLIFSFSDNILYYYR